MSHYTGCLSLRKVLKWDRVNFQSKILAVCKVMLIVGIDEMSCQTVTDDSFHFALRVGLEFTRTFLNVH